jgi:hypothetical protein
MTSKKRISEDQIEKIYELYLDKISITEIASKVNISNTSVRHFIRKKYPDCDLHYTRRKYSIDENYFKVVDTERKAYFLGLMYADGCVMSKKGSLISKIALAEEDNSILKVFKEEIKTDYPFFEYKRSKLNSNWKDVTEFRIGNPHFTKNLINLGCHFRKSNTLMFPNKEILPLELRSHFIRGYFDGDGSICINKVKNRRVVRFEGTLEFITELQKHFAEVLNSPFTKLQKRHKDRPSNAYTLQYYGNIANKNCKVFFDYFYKDATVYLERKYNKF